MRYINHTLITGEYSEELKIGCVIPIHKKGSKQKCSNYRPITKLSSIDKIFEEVMLRRRKVFLKDNNIIHENQYGFAENSSTLAASLNCIEKIYDNIDKNKYVSLISIDLEKAFDSVNLNILLNKLRNLNFKDTQIKLFENFLLNRKQATVINRKISNFKTVRNGVPQGSKLSATLFLIYINEILNLHLNSIAQFYADDGLMIFIADSLEK